VVVAALLPLVVAPFVMVIKELRRDRKGWAVPTRRHARPRHGAA
jgi:hypothetical protein